ncbi:unnamed protein product, partial [Didymodactylos carnosus]
MISIPSYAYYQSLGHGQIVQTIFTDKEVNDGFIDPLWLNYSSNESLIDIQHIDYDKKKHDLTVFDELNKQCDDEILHCCYHRNDYNNSLKPYRRNNDRTTKKVIGTNMEHEERFQKSLEKLTVPNWYNDSIIDIESRRVNNKKKHQYEIKSSTISQLDQNNQDENQLINYSPHGR